MKLRYPFILFLTFTVFLSCSDKFDDIRLGTWDYKYMHRVKKSLEKGEPEYRAAFDLLLDEAGQALAGGVYSVTFKDMVPPGGSKNDYMSMGPYWWPDPEQPDGLPYIRRDGEYNPERDNLDSPQYGKMMNSVRSLSLAWFFTGNTEYATKASELLRVWYLDPETRMNPHLRYAQSIPGRTDGRGIGIIDVMSHYILVDAIALLETSGEMDIDEITGIRTWFGEYLEWLLESQHGKDMDVYRNNHSVAYDVQTCGIAYYLGKDDFVSRKVSEIPERRIDPMIEADGSQPHELARTLAFSYSAGNLRNFFIAGEIGLNTGVDIFGYVNPKGGSLRKALDFLIEYIGREDDFPWEQISRWESTENALGILIRRAARIYEDQHYQSIWDNIFKERVTEDWTLLVSAGLKP